MRTVEFLSIELLLRDLRSLGKSKLRFEEFNIFCLLFNLLVGLFKLVLNSIDPLIDTIEASVIGFFDF